MSEKFLASVLEEAEQSGWSSRGGNLRFPICHGSPVSDRDLAIYCSFWMDPVTAPAQLESGWRPRADATDNTVIYMPGRDAVHCQGRAETVEAIAIIAAGFACRIDPKLVMASPLAAKFWNWTEKYRIMTKIDRPASSLWIPPETEKKRHFAESSTTPDVVTSRCVTEYTHVTVDQKWQALVSEAVICVQETDLKYVSPSLGEANTMMTDSLRTVMEGFNGQAYLRASMARPNTVTTGQLIAFCKRIWPDTELYQLGTRWRPAHLNFRKEVRGGIHACDLTSVSVDGSAAMCHGLAPVVAALRLRLDPEIARKTVAFQQFFDFVSWTRERPLPPLSVVSDIPAASWRREEDDAEFASGRFDHEEQVMAGAITVLRAEYVRTLGQYHGGTSVARWSKEDFVNNLMTWWPDAEIAAGARFRYIPTGLEKGGLEYYESNYFSVQGRPMWQAALMAMTASLMCGIPAEIAALLKACDVFWSVVMAECGGVSAVTQHRNRIRQIRERNFGLPGGKWDLSRATVVTSGLSEDGWGKRTSPTVTETAWDNRNNSPNVCRSQTQRTDWTRTSGHHSSATATEEKDWNKAAVEVEWKQKSFHYATERQSPPASGGQGEWRSNTAPLTTSHKDWPSTDRSLTAEKRWPVADRAPAGEDWSSTGRTAGHKDWHNSKHGDWVGEPSNSKRGDWGGEPRNSDRKEMDGDGDWKRAQGMYADAGPHVPRDVGKLPEKLEQRFTASRMTWVDTVMQRPLTPYQLSE